MSAPFRAVIFDLDGVLWDGEPLYHEAFNVVLAPYGHRVTDEDYSHIIGHSVESAWDWVLRHFKLDGRPERFHGAYDDAVLHLLQEPVAPLPGVLDLLAELRRRRLPVGVASASLRQWVDATLRGLGLESAFDAVVSASEVEHAKPAPDLYLTAAHRLGIKPDRCLAFEDTSTGLTAARAAGMFVVQVRAASTALPPIAQADLVIESYSEFDLGLVASGATATETAEEDILPAHPEASKE